MSGTPDDVRATGRTWPDFGRGVSISRATVLRRNQAEVADQPTTQLVELVRDAAKPDGAAWLDRSIAKIERGDDIAVLFPAAARKLGRGPLGAPVDARPHGASLAAWRVDDAGRVVLLGALRRAHPDTYKDTLEQLYYRGDAREKAGVLRGLAFYGGDAALVAIVLDALRTNQGTIFEAALCENPYTSAQLPDLEFRKNVLKAVFVGLSIRRIVDLTERADAELTSSLIHYIEEREAAGRSVEPELWPVIALHPPAGAAGKIVGYLEHPNTEHRTACADALATIIAAGDATPLPFLRSRAEREPDPAVEHALQAALARCHA